MHRDLPFLNRCLFPVMVVSGLGFLVWELATGGEIPKDQWALGVTAYGLAYGTASTYIDWIGKRVEELADEEELPDWVQAQLEKNRSKAQTYLQWGVIPYLLFFALRGRVSVGEIWVIGFLAANLAFQVGAFVGEWAIMAAQDRLLRDVEGWVKTRDARLVDSVA